MSFSITSSSITTRSQLALRRGVGVPFSTFHPSPARRPIVFTPSRGLCSRPSPLIKNGALTVAVGLCVALAVLEIGKSKFTVYCIKDTTWQNHNSTMIL